jgi:hydrogenase maturation factor
VVVEDNVVNGPPTVVEYCNEAVQEDAFVVDHENVIVPDDAVGWLAVAVTLITSQNEKKGDQATHTSPR